ncbi:MAG: alpha-mannosidase [Planctomycetota bacterium]|nr:MAG: alpha-mannosidase [Planctomycetota bacterium]
MAGKKTIHLLCNAHLDPVWLWEWEEGAAEAISTFRTAAELCESDDAFVFNHNEVALYKWVQEYDPALFERIRRLVSAGRWNIMGGWYLQPDCNMPSGESFVRQILLGKNWFKEHFGVDVTTAINFDPFGHTQGLVQILAKSGFDSYLFGRPDQDDCPLPADEFVWVGFDGSEVMATRFCGWYSSELGKARETIVKWIKDFGDKEHCLILWGVGNHGGGPSRKDLRDINRFIAAHKEHNIVHSTPQGFFKELKKTKDQLPRYKKGLNPWAIGCYTSQIRIKQKQRLLENEIYSTEKMCTAASVAKLMKYPTDRIREALHDLMMGQFHDILPGSSIQPVEESSLRMLDHGLEIISRIKAGAFFALGGGQPKAKAGQIPIMVYNPHPYRVRQLIECEFNLPDFGGLDGGLDDYTAVNVLYKGSQLPCQVEQELSNVPFDWRKRVVFAAELAPGRMNRFDCTLEPLSKKPAPKLKAQNGKITFRSKDLRVVISTRTGLVERYCIKGVDFVSKPAFGPLIIADDSDSWGILGKSRRRPAGRFRLMGKAAGSRFSGLRDCVIDSVRVIEDGPVRSVIEAVFSCGDSFICQRYKLPKSGTEIEVETRVHWNEKDRMLKLSVPLAGTRHSYIGQTAYGAAQLPDDGAEAVAQKWVGVVNRDKRTMLTCINNGTYGSDFRDGELRLTLLRSPAYSCHALEDQGLIIMASDRYTPRIDQGERLFRFWFNGGTAAERRKHIDREALVKNETPFALPFSPSGAGKKPKPVAVLTDDVVVITAIKKAEKGNDIIIRLFEPTGRKRTTVLVLPAISKKVKIHMGAFEIKTLRVRPSTGKIAQVNLLENPVAGRTK